MRSGAVRMKAAKKHGTGKHAVYGPQPGVKGPKAKGSMPMATHKLEGALSAHGAVSLKRLPNASEYQKGGRPSRGGGVKGSNTPGPKHIEHYPNKKAFSRAPRSAAAQARKTSTWARAPRSRRAAACMAAVAREPSEAPKRKAIQGPIIHHGGRTIMAKKKSHHDAVDDEPEAPGQETRTPSSTRTNHPTRTTAAAATSAHQCGDWRTAARDRA